MATKDEEGNDNESKGGAKGRLLQSLMEDAKKGPAHGRTGLGKAAFIGLRDEIQEAIDGHISMRTIWAKLQEQGRLNIGYATFRNYCKKYLAPPAQEGGRVEPVSGTRTVSSLGGPARRTFEPSLDVDMEKLLGPKKTKDESG